MNSSLLVVILSLFWAAGCAEQPESIDTRDAGSDADASVDDVHTGDGGSDAPHDADVGSSTNDTPNTDEPDSGPIDATICDGTDEPCDGICVDGSCVACTDNSHCDSGLCVEMECVDESVECTDDDACGANYCLDAQCVECIDDTHCEDGVCDDTQCIECTDDEHCNEGFCDDTQCIECTGDEHCALDELCDNTQCVYNEACDGEDLPDPDNFEDSNCDGVDGDASIAIFVAPHGDDDANDGTIENPVRTINRGIAMASAIPPSQRREVYIAEGTYHERIDLDEAISLYGGYRDNGDGTWDRSLDYETIIAGDDSALGHRPVEIRGVDSDITLQLLTIQAGDATAVTLTNSAEFDDIPGSSIGLVLTDNTGEVHLTHSLIETGRGANGPHGDDGEPGQSGNHGADATGTIGAPRTAIPNCSFEPNDYATHELPLDGGAGGDAGYNTSFDDGQQGDPASSPYDSSTTGADGGEAGEHYVQATSEEACQRSSDSDFTDGPGHDGDHAQGNQGSNRPDYDDEGNALSTSAPVVNLHRHDEIPPDGTRRSFVLGSAVNHHDAASAPGFRGTSGGGGGGAAAAFITTSSDPECQILEGGGGAAGGTGGCGGQGGFPGQWGGASIGILAVDSTLDVAATAIRTGNGGDGGDGGSGGSGGAGGTGGDGYSPSNGLFNGFHGGDGGDGLDGGDGADAPGGQGGASIGILTTDATIGSSQVDFEIGNPGDGGQGAGGDNDGQSGLSGQFVDTSE